MLKLRGTRLGLSCVRAPRTCCGSRKGEVPYGEEAGVTATDGRGGISGRRNPVGAAPEVRYMIAACNGSKIHSHSTPTRIRIGRGTAVCHILISIQVLITTTFIAVTMNTSKQGEWN